MQPEAVNIESVMKNCNYCKLAVKVSVYIHWNTTRMALFVVAMVTNNSGVINFDAQVTTSRFIAAYPSTNNAIKST